MKEIFLSYSRLDSSTVQALAAVLEEKGLSVWIDRSGIEEGDAYDTQIEDAIAQTRVVIGVVAAFGQIALGAGRSSLCARQAQARDHRDRQERAAAAIPSHPDDRFRRLERRRPRLSLHAAANGTCQTA